MRELFFLRAGRGCALRADSVRGYEALAAVARPRETNAAGEGCFQTLGGSLLYAACGARFRARSRRARSYTFKMAIVSRISGRGAVYVQI